MTYLPLSLLLILVASYANATSEAGCSSCGAIPMTKVIVGRNGNVTQFDDFEYSYDSGCGRAIGNCTAPVGHMGNIILQLNDSTKLSSGEPIKLFCNDDGQWIYGFKHKKIIVESVLCIIV